MKVYLAYIDLPYDNEELIGVFSSEANAQETINNKLIDYCTLNNRPLSDMKLLSNWIYNYEVDAEYQMK